MTFWFTRENLMNWIYSKLKNFQLQKNYEDCPLTCPKTLKGSLIQYRIKCV